MTHGFYRPSLRNAQRLRQHLTVSDAGLLVIPVFTTAFDPAKLAADGALSNGNRSLRSSAGTATALSTTGYTTGKYYFEVKCDVLSNVVCVGIARAGGGTALDTDLGQEAGEYSWHSTGNSYFAGSFGARTGAAIATGTVVGIAVDFTNRRLWIAVNNTWIVGNPATGTTPAVTYASGLGTIYAAASVTDTNDRVTSRFVASDLGYIPPAGFSAYGVTG